MRKKDEDRRQAPPVSDPAEKEESVVVAVRKAKEVIRLLALCMLALKGNGYTNIIQPAFKKSSREIGLYMCRNFFY